MCVTCAVFNPDPGFSLNSDPTPGLCLWPKEEKCLQFKSQTCFLVAKDATKAFKDLFEYDQTLEEATL